uniref:Krueppel homologous protein 1 n=1 Tax=Zeugodacus cucurbitae TaxID=28588 RepID=A0A0A1WCZ8_ZEUCU
MQSGEVANSTSITSLDFVDLSDYCRLCLQIPEDSQLLDLQLIYDEEEQLSYYDCFIICTQIDLHAGGINAPHQLCKSCGLELQVAYDFHKKVQESKKFLLQFQKSHITDGEALDTTMTKDGTQQETDILIEDLEQKTSDDTEVAEPIQLENESIDNEIATAEEENIEQLEAPIEYEELEEHIEMEEYQSVDELMDDDAETVQIRIDDDEYVIQKLNLSADTNTEALIEPLHKSTDLPKTTHKKSQIQNKVKHKFDGENVDSAGTDGDLTNDEINIMKSNEEYLQNNKTAITESKSDVNYVVISKKGDIQPRRRYSGKYSCEYCQKVFKNRSRMLTHRRSHEPDRPKYECEECGRLYATKQAKDVHVRSYHNRNGLKCPICDKVFVINKLLEVHMRYHTGDFPYVCDICGQKFAQMCHLNTHKNVKHNSVRFSCEHPGCGKYFTSSASLRNHEFSHGTMPFECAYCKRGYPAKAKLKVHIRQKHDIEVSLEQMEEMRKFHVMRSKLNLVKISK